MSDDERIARLTEIARKVWPDLEYVCVDTRKTCAWVSVIAPDPINPTRKATLDFAKISGHPRSLDALEAALVVLADEPYSVRLEACKKDCEGYWEQHKRARVTEALFAEALNAAELLWGVVANASGGNWAEESEEWRGAAVRARDSYLAVLNSADQHSNELANVIEPDEVGGA